MIWFTSDTHFGHANVLHFTDRPFGDIAHMNRALINACLLYTSDAADER